jgi:uncharacterized membrane protein YhaH (DUF805 family)
MLTNMNPFTGSINRQGFLLWNALFFFWVLGFGLLIDATKAHHSGVYWLPFRLGWFLILAIVSILVLIRRLQNAGLSLWLALLELLPFIGLIFWIALFFIPPIKRG